MIDFIRRNKVFASCFILCVCVIIVLGGVTIYRKLSGNDNPIDIPEVIHPNHPDKDPSISLFSGKFDDEKNVIRFVWDYDLGKHEFQKAEIYSKNTLVQTLNREMETEIDIFQSYISTGNNEFEIRIYYDEGIVVTRKTEVFVDYIFDVVMNHQLVDNNLGKGYLFSVCYHYNSKTPVGIPKIFINSTFSGNWDAKYVGKTTRVLQDNYQEIEAYYMVKFENYTDEKVTWNISYNFESVGVRVNDVVSENIEEGIFNTEPIQINK